jgi:hypothetical protein
MSDNATISQNPGQLPEKPTPKRFLLVLLSISILSLLTAAVVASYAFIAVRGVNGRVDQFEKLTNEKISELGTNIGQLAESLQGIWPSLAHLPTSEIDLTQQGWQELGHGLLITRISVAQHLTGVKVKGKIVNTLSVRQSKVSFSIQIGNSTKNFEIAQEILPGYGAPFEVYVPDVPLSSTNRATIQYQQSYMSSY